ncbi:MAG TPA: hypothetical protein PLQ69_09310 [Paludibacter sp.]|jgi:hypothetical protein|nr:hypothetical protein [Paludibacter sp.]HPM11253.1 hypothetical protein [Paludibacter sp.]
MARYTSEQDKYYQGMKLLIDLYYSYKSLGDKSDIAPEFIEKYIQIFRILLPGFDSFICIERKRLITFLYNRGDGINVEKPSNSIISYFEELIQSIDHQENKHFQSITLLGETVRSAMGNSKSNNKPHEFFFHEELIPKNIASQQKMYRLTARSKTSLDKKKIDKLITPQQVMEWGDEIDKEIYYPPYKHQTYEVEVVSAFGRKIVDYEAMLRRYNTVLVGIPYVHAPGYDKQIKFYEFLNGAFFGFHVAFGSFNRIKLCKYEPCKRLFVEKRLGSREYCSNICRKKHHDSTQDPLKRLCREKQNAWIRNKLSPVFHAKLQRNIPEYHVFMDDCKSCAEPVKGGLCKKLEDKYQDKYKKVFIALKNQRESKK